MFPVEKAEKCLFCHKVSGLDNWDTEKRTLPPFWKGDRRFITVGCGNEM